MKTILIDVDDDCYERIKSSEIPSHGKIVWVRVLRCAYNEAGEAAFTLDGNNGETPFPVNEERERKIQDIKATYEASLTNGVACGAQNSETLIESLSCEQEGWLRTRTNEELDELKHYWDMEVG